jgi:hypothetical protein
MSSASGKALLLAFATAAALHGSLTAGQDPDADAPPSSLPSTVEARFFYQPGCDECAHLTSSVLPLVMAQFADMLKVVNFPLDVASNRSDLLQAVARAGAPSNERVYMDVARRHLLAGAAQIESDMVAAVNMAISEPRVVESPYQPDGIRRLASQLTVAGVALAGMIDSINPCAVAALVFLVSVLTLARERPVNIIAAGLSYCLGVFLTYTSIGFGLLHAFRAMESFPAVRLAFDILLCGLLSVLSFLSFRDAAMARRSGPGGSTMRLPDALAALVRRTIRHRFGATVGLASAFAAGVVVTAVETVCTGQVYGPTLAAIVAGSPTAWREAALLLLYNTMFVAPLLVILFLAWRGMTLARLLQWSARNAVAAKVVMGLFFAALLTYVAITRLWP